MREGLPDTRHLFPRWSLSGLLATALLICLAQNSKADFEQRVITDDDGEHSYAIFVPESYSADKKWPVVLFLHGAGERGRDGKRQLTIGLAPAIKKRQSSFPFIAVFPQCEDTSARYLAGWLADSPDAKRALKILNQVENDYSIDTSRRILTGWSMGGYGTWSVAAATPSKWQAILPLAGGGADLAGKLVDVPVWAFHGSEDAAIRPAQSRRTIAALRSAGAKPRYTEIAGGKHDITHIVYDTDARHSVDARSERRSSQSVGAPSADRRCKCRQFAIHSGARPRRSSNRSTRQHNAGRTGNVDPESASERLAPRFVG